MVMQATKEYATPKQIEILKSGTSKKQLTRDLWLTPQQAKDLGYNQGEGDFLLTPTAVKTENLYGGVPQPSYLTNFYPNLSNTIQKLYPDVQGATIDDVKALASQETDIFVNHIRSIGRNQDTLTLLKAMDIPDDVIDQIIPPPYMKPQPQVNLSTQGFLKGTTGIGGVSIAPTKVAPVAPVETPTKVTTPIPEVPGLTKAPLAGYEIPHPIITLPSGQKMAYPMTDQEWQQMTPNEQNRYKTHPQEWLKEKKAWENVRKWGAQGSVILEALLSIEIPEGKLSEKQIESLTSQAYISLAQYAAFPAGEAVLKGVFFEAKTVIPALGKIEKVLTAELSKGIKPPEIKPPEVKPTEVPKPAPTVTTGTVVKPPVTTEVTKLVPDEISDISGYMFSGSASKEAQSNWFSGSIDKALDFAKARLKSGRGGEPVVRIYKTSDIESKGVNKLVDLMESSGKQIPSSEYSMMYLKDIKPTYTIKLTKGFDTTKEDILAQIKEQAIPKAEVGMPEAVKPRIGVIPKTPEEAISMAKELDAELAQVKPLPKVEQTKFVDEYVASKGQKLPSSPPEPPTAKIEFSTDMPASQQVANHISFEPDKVSLSETLVKGKNKAMTDWVDKLHPIDKFVDVAKKSGVELSLEENPYIQARMLEGVTSKATTFLDDGTFGRKFWKIEKGKAVPNFKGEGLSKILEPVKEPEAWRDFSTYLTSLRAEELNKLGIETGISKDVATKAIAELETKYPNFSKLSDKIQKYQSDLLDYIQESGLISPELRAKLDSKYASYVPFYRVLEELQGKGYMGKKMVNVPSLIKRIKGSEREIVNPLESIVKNTYAFINAADRNEVGVAMARLVHDVPELQGLFNPIKTPMAKVANVTAKELGIDVAGLEGVAEEVFDIFRPSMFTKENVVTVMIDGKKQFFKVDPDLGKALTAMDTGSMGMLWKILASPAKWLRAGATLSPDFMIRNPLRDAMSAMVYSNYGFIPGVDTLRGVASILRKDAAYKLYKMSGAEHSMLVSLDREYLQSTFKEIVEGKKFTDFIRHPLQLLQIASELGEKATRLGEFAKGIKKGVIPLEAGFSSREVTLDFAKAGTQAKSVNQIIAFFNANIRGWDRMVMSFKEHPIRTSAKVIAGITIPSIALWSVNHDDPRWKEIPQWQKDLFWIVMVGDNIYRIPKPFELGVIFGSGPERLLDYLNTKDPKIAQKFLGDFFQSGTPGWLPTGLEPIIENITNHSFFKGTPVVSQSLEDLPPELQYTDYTSEVAKGMGKLLHQSPLKIDNILYGWTGGLGRYATEAIDKVLQKTGVVAPKIEPSPTLADLPITRAFVVRNPLGSSSESVNNFYDEYNSYIGKEKLLKGLIDDKKQAEFDKEKAKYPELLFAYDSKTDTYYSASARYLRQVSGELSGIRKLEDKVYKDTSMTPEQKRTLIDSLDQIKTDMANRALELIKNPSKEVGILETPVSEVESKLGTITGSPLSQDVVKMTDIAPDLIQAKGESPLKKLLETNNKILADIANLPDQPLYQIDRTTTKAGLTRRQNELLDQYDTTPEKDKKKFIADHPELSENPKVKWLTDNPESNAILALWGNSKLLTQKAYDIAVGLVGTHDIPNNALEERVLPPKDLATPYFELVVAKEKWGDSSWEAKLIIAKNPKLVEWNPAWSLPDTPIASLELKVKNRTLYDTISSYSDSTSPQYIVDEKERAKAVAKLKADNPVWVDDMRRVEAIENGGLDLAVPKPISIPDAMSLVTQAKTGHVDQNGKALDSWSQTWLDNYDFILKTLSDIQKGQPNANDINKSLTILNEDYRHDTPPQGWENFLTQQQLPLGVTRETVSSQMALGWSQVKASQAWLDISGLLNSQLTTMGKPNTAMPSGNTLVETHVAYGKLQDKQGVGSSSAESMLFRVDNPQYDQWRTDTNIWGDQALKPVDQTRIPIWRIDVKYTKQDIEYNAIKNTVDAEQTRLRNEYLTKNPDYRIARRQRDFYNLNTPLVTNLVLRDKYVGFYESSDKGYVKEHYRLDNPELDAVLTDPKIMGNSVLSKVDPTKIPDKRYDEIYTQFQPLFDQWDSYGQGTSPNYIANPDDRTKARDTLLAQNPDFKKARWEQDAYLLFIGQEKFVPDYLGYKDITDKGKPAGQTYWFEDDWYLLDHPEFYKTMVTNGQWQERDFSKVPPRDVYELYQIYDAIIGDPKTSRANARLEFRRRNPKLDAWLVLIGAVSQPIEEYDVTAGMTTAEKVGRTLAAKRAEIDRLKAEIDKKLKAMK
jgi:hypothetical protein